MKTQTKTKIVSREKASRRPSSKSPAVVLVHAKRPCLRHFRLVNHKHTGKLIHIKHTSHLALLTMLCFVGFFLLISNNYTQAETTSSTVSVGLIVTGPAPTIGAQITSPVDGAKLTDETTVEVSGTCLANMFVVIQNNNALAGSTVCDTDGTFKLEIQVQLGDNALSALNYDNLNQPGPVTPTVTIVVKQTKKSQTDNGKKDVAPIEPVLPTNPSYIPDIISNPSNCDNYNTSNLPTGGVPHVAVVCIPRLFGPKLPQVMGILVWGGLPPYAININWGNGSDSTLLSLPTQGYKKVTFSYAVPGIYKIALRLKDAANNEAIVQTAVQVTGEAKTPVVVVTNDTFDISSWFKTPVPMYIVAVATTLGFWVGDIFTRKFVTLKYHRKIRRSA